MEFKQTNKLETFATNLNKKVLNNEIDPIIGREDEIRKVIEILNRKNKNNPILIGEPGVGKTAIVEGIAQRIVNKDVPDALKDKEIWELSLSSLISGASYQGQFEERLNNVIKAIKESNGRIILFIDEIHQLVGMGRNGNSSMDAANILKPMLARGEIKLIGATTLKEYRDNIEKDSAFERRMTKVYVSEPTKQEALTIMRGLKEKWELFHGVKIADNALVAAVDYSSRYITDRFLPDKAIDLVDEACAKIQIELNSMPEELDQIKRKIVHLKTENIALSKETDNKSKHRLEEIKIELEDLTKKEANLEQLWNEQKKQNESIISLKKQIDESKSNVEKYQSMGEYAKASELLYVTIPKLEQDLSNLLKDIKQSDDFLVSDVVTDKEIAEVISKSIGIPLNKIYESEKQKLLNLKSELEKYVKGQDEAIQLVSDAIIRSRVGINDENRPIGSFLFLGPTGVGKTEVAKAISNTLFDTQKSLIRIDMSEYMEKHSVSKLIGAPPGYVGYDQPGVLTEAVRQKPYSIVLLDEIEKAHKDVLNILLQILDEGAIKDNQGKTINFKNTIIILTSNIGSNAILENKKEAALDELKTYLKPEILNRIDEIVIFNALSDETIDKVINKFLAELSTRLSNNNYDVVFDKSVTKLIKERGYDPVYGARPLKRFIQRHIETQLSEMILKEAIVKGKKYNISFDTKTDKLTII